MLMTVIESRTSPVIDEFVERLAELQLIHYASEAAFEMEFDSLEELQESVKRALEICISSGIPLKGNFMRVYKCANQGIIYDWKLSPLAYRLVCLCGNPANPAVARLMVHMIKEQQLKNI